MASTKSTKAALSDKEQSKAADVASMLGTTPGRPVGRVSLTAVDWVWAEVEKLNSAKLYICIYIYIDMDIYIYI